jgi:sugar (pentulose or hexulose) kinase
MSTDLILAIDQGTTGTTCLLVDADLQVRARATREFPQHFPQPGWVEHDPEELWQSVLATIAEVMRSSGIAATRVVAIGITNQRETSLIWDRHTGEPLHRALVWQDRRTAGACEACKAGRPRRARSGQDRPGARPLLLGHQARSGCSTTSPARAPAPRPASSPPAPSTPTWCGGSAPARPTSASRATPHARS